MTNVVQKHLAKCSTASVSGKEHVNDFESVSESVSDYDIQFGYDVLDILSVRVKGILRL